MRAFLRNVYYGVIRVLDLFRGPNRAVWLRLHRQGRASMGVHTYGYPIIKSFVHDTSRLVVGKYSALSETAIVMLGGGHPMDRVSTYPLRIQLGLPGAGADGFPTESADTVIGSDVWLGQRAFVFSGVTIGDGAVIGACSVVTRDVPPYAVMVGSPAKVVRFRHTEEQRAALLDIRWWDWPEEEIARAVDLINGDDVDAFIAYARERFPAGAGHAEADGQSGRRTRTT